MELEAYCDIVSDYVDIEYRQCNPLSILGAEKPSPGKKYIESCSHSNQCNISDANCPFYKKLNNR